MGRGAARRPAAGQPWLFELHSSIVIANVPHFNPSILVK